jgi:phosphoribosyl 1,2-cyclic phosphodiesterase
MKSPVEEKMLVTFWGTRGSISTPGRTTEKYGGNTPCVTIVNQGARIILDAGTGIRNLGIELVGEVESRKEPLSIHLFLSHTHWDHIQGLPFFQPAYLKDTKMTIYGSPKKERFLASVLKRQMDYEYFPVSMSALTADIRIQEMSEENLRLGPITIEWEEQVFHPGGSVRYRFSAHGKKVVYATDVELDLIFGGDHRTQEKEAAARDYLRFVHGADLLIADGMFSEEEYPARVGWGHASIPAVIDAASRADVKQLAMFHHDPQHSDKVLDDLWGKYRSRYLAGPQKMDLFWAREGLTLAV